MEPDKRDKRPPKKLREPRPVNKSAKTKQAV